MFLSEENNINNNNNIDFLFEILDIVWKINVNYINI